MMGGFLLVWLVVLAAIVYVVIVLARRSGPGTGLGPPPPPPGNGAEQILKERFARGEIDRDEYDERLRELRR